MQSCSILRTILRRLKHLNVISNYRLDENGNTQIALSVTTQSFRFTGLEQSASMQVVIPAQIRDEIKHRREQISQNETKSASQNNEKSRRLRANPPTTRPQNTKQNFSEPPTGMYSRPPLTGSNTAPIYSRPSVPPPNPIRPTYGRQFQPPDSRSKQVKRPSLSPITSPGQAMDLSTSQHPPPPNQGQSPQLSYTSYPQSYWSTPPPGEGPLLPPPPHTAGLTGTTSQSAGLKEISSQNTGLRGTGPQHAGLTVRGYQSAGFSDYEQRGGYHQVWQH